MMRFGLPLLLLVVTPLHAAGPVDEAGLAVATEAETAFRLGLEHRATPLVARRDFARAAELYRDLLGRGVRSPALYRNLGNAELHAGRIDRALWAYHSGLRLDPNDRRLREQRDHVRGLVSYPPDGRGRPADDAWPPFLPRPTPWGLSVTAIVSYPLACLLLTAWWLRRDRGILAAGGLAAGVLLLSLLGGWWLSSQQEYEREHPLVIVARANAPLLRGNGPSYPPHPDVPPLPRGQEARTLVRRGGWLQVQLPGGAVGWLPAEGVLVVE